MLEEKELKERRVFFVFCFLVLACLLLEEIQSITMRKVWEQGYEVVSYVLSVARTQRADTK